MIKKAFKGIGIILLVIGLIYIIYSIFSFGYYSYRFGNDLCINTSGEYNDFLEKYNKGVRESVNNIKTKFEKVLKEDEDIYLCKLSCKTSNYLYCFEGFCECSDDYDEDQFYGYDVILNKTKWAKDYLIIGKKKISTTSGGITEEGLWIDPENECPKGEKYQCPMGLCIDDETGESYPCQHTCFCTNPHTMF